MTVRNEPDIDFAGMPILPEGVGNFYGVDPRTQPNEIEVIERLRSAAVASAVASGDWDSYLRVWDPHALGRKYERENGRER